MRTACLVFGFLLWSAVDVAVPSSSQSTGSAPGAGKFSTPSDAFSPATFHARRQRLAAVVPDGVVVLIGAKAVIDGWEEHRYNPIFRVQPLRQQEHLFYLTGLSVPNAIAVFDTRAGTTMVYVPDATGHVQGELDRLALGTARSLDRLDADLEATTAGRVTYLLLRPTDMPTVRESFGQRNPFPAWLPGSVPGTFAEDHLSWLFGKRFPRVDVRSITSAVEALWKVPDQEEVAALKRAVEVSAAGLRAGIMTVAPGVDEREVAAEIEHAFKRAGAQHIAYAADIQSGPNALRGFIDVFGSYDLANRTMQGGEVVMVDHSAEVNYYVSDLARTVPVSGRFTREQRLAYETYLVAYEAGLKAIGPGVPFMRAGQAAAEALRQKMKELPEWLRKPAETWAARLGERRPGHFLGLNLHIHEDYESPLQPGQVMAYELHLYIPEKGWRFTVEDAVLVTGSGHEVLSRALPRSVESLEQLMSGRGR
jgi:Xaa-Pro aminopeptidase